MLTKTNDIQILKDRLSTLEGVVAEVLFMARRYANGRRTFAASTVNRAIDTCLEMGIKITEDQVDGIKMYAKDGDLGRWLPEQGKFKGEL